MKAGLSILTLSFALGVALAQTTPPNPPPQETPKKATPTNPQTNAQPDAKAGTPTGESATLAEMKTTTFKGVLVDMSCSSGASDSTPKTAAAGGGTQPAHPAEAPASDKSNSANRSAS